MKKFNWWWLLLLVPFFAGLAMVYCGDGLLPAEKAVHDFLYSENLVVTAVWRGITELGSAVGAIGVTVVIFTVSLVLQIKGKKALFSFGMPVTITVIVSRIINMIIKEAVDRDRPNWAELKVGEKSFPSGHAMNNMSLYVALLIVVLLVVTAPKWRAFFRIALVSLPIIIGVSRIFFGVHYISDVVAGWSIGAFVAVICCYFYFKIHNNIKEKYDAKNRVCT